MVSISHHYSVSVSAYIIWSCTSDCTVLQPLLLNVITRIPHCSLCTCLKGAQYYAVLKTLYSFKTSGNTNTVMQHHTSEDPGPQAGKDCSNFIKNTRPIISVKIKIDYRYFTQISGEPKYVSITLTSVLNIYFLLSSIILIIHTVLILQMILLY